MTEPRINFLYIIVGMRGCGKTDLAKQLETVFLALSPNNKSIVVDTTPHPKYANFTNVDIDGLIGCKDKFIRCEEAKEKRLFEVLNTYQRNAFVIFEDAKKYIKSNVNDAVVDAVIDMRKRNFEFVFMFHTLSDVPPYLAENYDKLILFKSGFNYDKNLTKFTNYHKIKAAGLEVEKHKNKHYNRIINK